MGSNHLESEGRNRKIPVDSSPAKAFSEKIKIELLSKPRVNSMAEAKRVGLQEAIAALRAELIESVVASQGELLRFEVGEITMEFQIEVERSADAKGGIKFWVVEFGVGGTAKNKEAHKVVIPLRPIRANGKPILTGGNEVPE